MKLPIILWVFVLACIAMLQCPFASASDIQVPVPSGWTPSPFFFAGSQNRVAVAIDQGDPVTNGSRIMQSDLSGTPVYTDVTGKVADLKYSPDGASLLAFHLDSNDSMVTLINNSGTAMWTKVDDRAFGFSTTGNTVYAWQSGGGQESGREVEVFDLGGTTVRKVNSDGPVVGVVVVGDGEGVIMAVGHSLMRVSTTGEPEIEWNIHLAATDPPTENLKELDGGTRFVVEQTYGHFEIRNLSDGSIVYDYDPDQLAGSGGSKTEYEYMQYRPYPTQLAQRLLLSDESSQGLLLNLTTGALVPIPLNVTTPPGYTLLHDVEGSKRVLIGSSEIRIRQVAVIN